MSINVTVTGNPVCIKRGKMVTADPKDVHKEFQKRRKMRIEQVRQQSKEIAESVRNKVRKEKSKQLSTAEKESASKFNEWQNTKLLELQNQYRESLKDIGAGHTQARVEEAVEADYMERRDKYNEAAAQSRGQLAKQHEQITRNEENLKKALPAQRRRLARDVENTRSAMVCQLRKEGSPIKKKKKNRKKSLINVSITKDVSESDSDVVSIVDFVEDNGESSESSEETEVQDSAKVSPKKKKAGDVVAVAELRSKEVVLKSKELPDDPKSGSSKVSPSKHIQKTSLVTVTTTDTRFDAPFDTRISDRIKNRRLIDSRVLSNYPSRINEISESSSEDTGIRVRKENINADVHIPPEPLENCGTQTSNNCKCSKENKCTCSGKSKTQQTQTSLDKQNTNLPSIPTVSLRSGVSQNNPYKRDYTRVQYYDHDNRFNNDYIIDTGDVQKISEDSIQVCVSEDPDGDFQKRGNFERDKAAQIRGRRALEKQKIQRDYEDLMKKLPVLQKQERIAGLDPEKDKFHMSDKRLKDYEKNRQGRIEQAFEMLVPNTITIQPKTQKHREKSPVLKIIDVPQKSCRGNKNHSESDNNLAWKSVTNLLSHSNSKTNHEHLRCLLEKLKAQKEILMQENSSMPENSRLGKLLADLEKCNKKSSGSSTSSTDVKRSCKSPKKQKHSAHNRDVLILQNMSTQTSPKIENVNKKGCDPMCGKSSGKCCCLNKARRNAAVQHDGNCLCKEKKCKTKQYLPAEIEKEVVMDGSKCLCNVRKKTTNESEVGEKCCCKDKVRKKQMDESESGDVDKKCCCKDNVRKKQMNESESGEVGGTCGCKDVRKKQVDGKCCCKEKNNARKTCLPSETIDGKYAYREKHTSVSSELEDVVVCVKHDGTCTCKDEDDKICEIFIKIQDNEKPEIVISSPKDKKGAVTVDIKQLENEDEKKKPGKKKECKTDEPTRRKNKNQNESFWREQLSKNDAVNSSTSYYSPPDYSKNSTNDNILQNILMKKPQQSNVNMQTSSQNTDAYLLQSKSRNAQTSSKSQTYPSVQTSSKSQTCPSAQTSSKSQNFHSAQTSSKSQNGYSQKTDTDVQRTNVDGELLPLIKKLLEMSKGSIERLYVSSISEVSTPSSSVIEHPNNINPAQKLINLLKNLNIDVDRRTKNLNKISKKNQTDTSSVAQIDSEHEISCTKAGCERSVSPAVNAIQLQLPARNNESPENQLVRNITEITDKCQEKINQLTEKIQSLRAEKNQMLSPVNKSNASENDTSTGYMVLPGMHREAHEVSSRSTSPEQRELTKKLVQVNLVDSPDTHEKASNVINSIRAGISRGDYDEADADVMNRYVKLIALPPSENDPVPFVPVLLDIPKLPKLTAMSSTPNAKKPPPSKGLRYNNLDMIPHELSTIPEADSVRRSKSPPESPKNQEDLIQVLLRNSRNNKSPPNNDLNSLHAIPVIQSPKRTNKIELSGIKTLPSSRSNQSTSPSDIYKNPIAGPSREVPTHKATSDELIGIMKRLQEASTDSSTEKSGEIESLLKSLGMNWAVATLKKTQEALAQNSSSNSSSSTSKITTSSSTDINQTMSSNSLSCNFQDVSCPEKRNTSTPVQTTRSSGREHMFAGESELSSVKDRSKDNNESKFISMPNVTEDDSSVD